MNSHRSDLPALQRQLRDSFFCNPFEFAKVRSSFYDLMSECQKQGISPNTLLFKQYGHDYPFLPFLIIQVAELLEQPDHPFKLEQAFELMTTFLEGGGNVNLAGVNGHTALHFSVGRKLPEVCSFLLCHGADPNIIDSYDETPLHDAGTQGGATLKMILEHPSFHSKNAINKHGHSALSLAIGQECYDKVLEPDSAVRTLLAAGVDLECPVSLLSGGVLHQLSQYQDIAVTRCLIEAGASMTLQNKEGCSVLDQASYHGNAPLIQLLIEKGYPHAISHPDIRKALQIIQDRADQHGSPEQLEALSYLTQIETSFSERELFEDLTRPSLSSSPTIQVSRRTL